MKVSGHLRSVNRRRRLDGGVVVGAYFPAPDFANYAAEIIFGCTKLVPAVLQFIRGWSLDSVTTLRTITAVQTGRHRIRMRGFFLKPHAVEIHMMSSFRAARSVALLFAASWVTISALAAEIRVYVQFQPGEKAAAQAALSQLGARSHHEFDDLNAVAVSIAETARDALARNPAIALIEEDPVRGFLAQQTPYGISMVQAPEAIAAGATGAGITVGVVDSGVFRNHEDFAGVTLTGEPDLGSGDQRTWYRDYLSHGTHVVGTIAAANNSLGVVGVSPGNVSIHMVKVFGDTGNWIYSSDLLTACRAAQSKGAKVISMSLGGSRGSLTEDSGMNDLYNNKGVLLVAAAGNGGSTAVSYPAGYASVISVAAIDSGKTVAWFSQKNSDVELAAPGVGVLSTVSDTTNSYGYFDGTSMATPHVSGVAALIWSKYPGATNAQVRSALTSSAQDLGAIGRDTSYGYGLVQAKAALDALAALNPGSGSGGTGGSTDTAAPVISNVAGSVTNAKNGSFTITWTTNEPASSEVVINGATYSDSTLTTNHKRNFRGSKGASYTYSVSSTDGAGNTATAGPFTISL
jgi:serine protease